MRRYLILFAALLLVGCHRAEEAREEHARVEDPAPAVKGESQGQHHHFTDGWTHKELAEYLNQHGVKVEVTSAVLFSSAERPASFFSVVDKDKTPSKGVALVYLCKDRQSAIEVSGSMGKGSFSVGRFAFGEFLSSEEKQSAADQQLLLNIKNALVR